MRKGTFNKIFSLVIIFTMFFSNLPYEIISQTFKKYENGGDILEFAKRLEVNSAEAAASSNGTTWYLSDTTASTAYGTTGPTTEQSTATDITPAVPTFKSTALAMTDSPGAAAVTKGGIIGTGNTWYRTFLSPKLAAQTLASGMSFNLALSATESNIAANAYTRTHVYVWREGFGKVSTLIEGTGTNCYSTGTTALEYGTTGSGRSCVTAATASNATLLDGDQIAVEVWVQAVTGYTQNILYGGPVFVHQAVANTNPMSHFTTSRAVVLQTATDKGTRWYLSDTTASTAYGTTGPTTEQSTATDITPAVPTFKSTALAMTDSPGAAAVTKGGIIGTGNTWYRTFLSPKLAAQTLASGMNFNLALSATESNAAANAYTRTHVYVWREGFGKVSTLIEGTGTNCYSTGTTALEYGTTGSGRSCVTAATASNATLLDGDQIAVEVWVQAVTGYTENILYGGPVFVHQAVANTNPMSHFTTSRAVVLQTTSTPTVTLSNLVTAEPGNFTVAPGASAQVDSFGIVVNTGTDTLTNAVVTMTTGMGQYVSNVALTNDGDTATYCNATPSGDTATFTGCTLPVTTTNTQYKVRLTAKSHALMPAPAGGAYAIGATVTSFTATGAEAGTDTGSSTLTIDNASPNGATSVSGTSGVNKNTINWTSSSSSDFHTTNGSVLLRWTGSSVGAGVPAEGNSSYLAGDAISSATVACVISSAVSTALSKIDGTGGSAGCTTASLTNGQAYTYKVFQRDTNGNYDAGVLIGTFTPYGLPTVTTQAVTNIAGITAIGNGNVTSDGGGTITERGVVWNTLTDPTTSNGKATASGTTGAFTANISGLTKNTLYYVRAYAINSAGTSYGGNVTFTTLIEPTVATVSASEIAETTAVANSNITNTGGAVVDIRGVVYDIAPRANPGNVAPASSLYPSKVEETGSFSTGVFSSNLINLTGEVTYYFRSYAHNSVGYSYGNEISFTTLAATPVGMPISGTLTSSVFNTANSSSIGYNSIMWKGTLGGEGKVRFQFASSVSSTGPWNFYGGNTCISGDWFDPLGPETPIEIKEGSGCLGAWNNNRYFRYKVQICSKDCVDAGLTTPVIDSIVVNWSL